MTTAVASIDERPPLGLWGVSLMVVLGAHVLAALPGWQQTPEPLPPPAPAFMLDLVPAPAAAPPAAEAAPRPPRAAAPAARAAAAPRGRRAPGG
ncbi:hypothetical protein [Pararhodospirillum photometricum]|uniref:Uncharacterized protein n=1 Tax=Pararhodospirillum photometricum DSM 122 TaxID=1150469 RepID=H6SQZ3_PARPM|nr:hypothetical protein [Pararhodospirillum photometricum]CCG09715.1 unnamed protein product [Pararhodospirillum photometricum DSM 122]